MVEELDTTVVLPPGTAARVDAERQHRHRSPGGVPTRRPRHAADDAIDPITFEVLRNAFMSIVDEMGLMLERVAHSLVVSEGRDFSAAICDADGRIIAEGKEDLPAHVGTLPHTVKAVIDVGRQGAASTRATSSS